MTFKQIYSDLEKGNYQPIYFLMGDESYFIDKITDYIAKNALPEDQKVFNQMVLYGKDIEAGTVDTTARRFPMMADRMVVIVKEAQNLKKIEDLVYYAQKPQKSTVLVINYKYKKLPKNRKLYKALKKTAVILESKKLYDNQVTPWITEYLKERKFSIDQIASRMLTDYLGTDLKKIVNELDKLSLIIPAGSKITPKIIEENVGISKDYNNFELQNALTFKNLDKANKIINYFTKNPKDNPFVLTLTALYFFFVKVLMVHYAGAKSDYDIASKLKVSPFFVKGYVTASKKYNKVKLLRIISLLREYDLKSKGVGNVTTSHGELLKELIFKIIN